MVLLFFCLFLIFSGKITLEIAIFGAVLAIVMTVFCVKFLDYRIRNELLFLRLLPHVIAYFFVLIIEIIKANISVIPLIVSPKYEVEPVLISFCSPLKTDLAKTILADSITLTPGTITVELTDREYLIHCLDREFSKDLCTSVFVKRLQKMEMIFFRFQQTGGRKK